MMIQKLRWFFLFTCLSSIAYSQSYHNEWIDFSKTYYKFSIGGFGTDAVGAPVPKGLVRIPYSALSAAGLAGIPAEHFQLWRDGAEVPLYMSKASGSLSSGDYIEFYGQINTGKLDNELYRDPDYQLSDYWSLQTDTAAYFLTANAAGNNKRIEDAANQIVGNSLPATPYFMHTVGRYYRAGEISNGFNATAVQNLYSSSYDKGEGFTSRPVRPVGCSQASLPQNFANLYPFLAGPQMQIKISAVGNAQNSRIVKVNLNNDSLTLFQMDYLEYSKVEELSPVSRISSGAANFVIINQSPAVGVCDEMRVSFVELTYPRHFNLGGASQFEINLNASTDGHYLKIANFNTSGIAPVLYDVSNGKKYIGDISIADTVQFLLPPSTLNYQLVLSTQSGTFFKNIAALTQRNFIDFSNTNNQGDYLIISNPLIYGSGASNYVEQYRQYRLSVAGGSYAAKVVDINELVDQFAWGVKKHPLSIRNFLKYARANFATAPKFAFLIGKGVTYNAYRANENNALIERLNLVPTWGNPASDNLLASDDEFAIPKTPIGRLSAVSAAEVGDYLIKVKQYDSAQNSPDHTIEAKGWMKNILQVAGANDISLGSQLDSYLSEYKTIISDTAFGGSVSDFSKTADPAKYPEAINSFKDDLEKGAALVTYFGHSSATSLDFNLDDPQNYSNRGKYPTFLVNGCSAGNHFLFEANRLNSKTTISERFVLAPQRGAIGYLASTHYGVVNYLHLYTQEFYKAISTTKYGQPVGVIMQEAITKALGNTGFMDFYSRLHAEQYAFHGDPAIRFNKTLLPDYVIEATHMQSLSPFVSVADTSFAVKVRVHNIGRALSDSLTLKITREYPDGRVEVANTSMLAPLAVMDSVTIRMPIIANRDKGINKITAVVDYNDDINEVTNANNSASIQVNISEDEIRPIFPYNYAIVNQPLPALIASTVNPLKDSVGYVVEIDSTSRFNSTQKVTQTAGSKGGVISFTPAITYQNGRTYYWRVAPAGIANPHWNVFSFTYKPGAIAGFQQGHLFQNLQSDFSKIVADSINGKLAFTSKTNNLFITNSIYPSSGTEDAHFSISVNGNLMISSACVGSSVIFNVFDSLTFRPWLNTAQPYGAGAVCGAGREYNFEYSYLTAESRNNAKRFLDSIPKGSFVTARLILDPPYNVFAGQWAADSTIYGAGNTLYSRLKQYGFAKIDSFNKPRTWAFVCRKNDTAFAPQAVFSDSIFDRITLSVNCKVSNIAGTITSPVFGPAKAWKNVVWNGYSSETGNDKPIVNVIGIDPSDTETVLFALDASQQVFDISTADATLYPRIKLQMENTDSTSATPYQLTDWRIEYDAVPEGALAPNLYFSIADTAGHLPSGDTLHIGVAFKNVSKVNFDTIAMRVVLYDSANNATEFMVPALRPIAAGDTAHIDINLLIGSMARGMYNMLLVVNPGLQQGEQYYFNNFMYKNVFIDNVVPLPVSLLNFNAYASGKNVMADWLVTAENNVKHYTVQHAGNPNHFRTIGKVMAVNNGALHNSYTYTHLQPLEGKNYYRVQVTDNDGSVKYSPVRLVNFGKTSLVNVYPNPVKDRLHININNVSGKLTEARILNTYGQQMWQEKVAGSIVIDVTQWASGVYLLQVDDGHDKTTFKIHKL